MKQACRITTHSTGGNNASLDLERGYYDTEVGTFTTVGEVTNVDYHDVSYGEKMVYSFIGVEYGVNGQTKWSLTSEANGIKVAGSDTRYSTGDLIRSWGYDITLSPSIIAYDTNDNHITRVLEAYGSKIVGFTPNGGSSGSDGHTIVDESGSSMTSRTGLQFVDSFVQDDSTNDRTKVEVIKRVTKAQLEALGANTDGIYETTDEDDEPWADASDDYVEVTADGEKTYATLLSEIYNDSKFDITKISKNTVLKNGDQYYYFFDIINNEVRFTNCRVNNSNSEIYTFLLKSSYSLFYSARHTTSGNTVTNSSTDKPSSGSKITLYYGTKSGIVELNTDAQHCIMSDGETSVEGAISGLTEWKTSPTLTLGSNISSATFIYLPFGSRNLVRGSFTIGTGGISSNDVIFSGGNILGQGAMSYSCPYASSGVATYLNGALIANASISASSGNSYTFCGII